MTAHDILNNPFLNKGTAFTLEEREGTRSYWFIATVCSNDWKNKRRKLMHKCKQSQ